MLRLFKNKSLNPHAQVCASDGDACQRILNEQLGYITKVCNNAMSNQMSNCRLSITGDGGASYNIQQNAILDADELFVHVVDHLKEDDYRRLREFKGRSSIPTYLTTIIGRLVVDIVRQRTGRNRAKERAELHGELGRHVYSLMIKNNHTAVETAEILFTNFSIQSSVDDLRSLHSDLLGRDTRHQSCSDTETTWGENGEFVVIQRNNPEMELMGHTQNVRRRDVLAGLIEGLSGEERLLMRLRFPLDDNIIPLDIEQIAVMTGLTTQKADRKLRRILQSCREELLGKGLSLEDLL